MFRPAIITVSVVTAWLIVAQEPSRSLRRPGAFVRISGASPFAPGCNGQQTGTNFRNSSVEPFAAVDPGNSAHIVGVWQQDRWLDGGSSGLLAAVSFDQGRTWTASSARFSLCTGGVYDRASDPWVAIS